jgi:hypothetical protein
MEKKNIYIYIYTYIYTYLGKNWMGSIVLLKISEKYKKRLKNIYKFVIL